MYSFIHLFKAQRMIKTKGKTRKLQISDKTRAMCFALQKWFYNEKKIMEPGRKGNNMTLFHNRPT